MIKSFIHWSLCIFVLDCPLYNRVVIIVSNTHIRPMMMSIGRNHHPHHLYRSVKRLVPTWSKHWLFTYRWLNWLSWPISSPCYVCHVFTFICYDMVTEPIITIQLIPTVVPIIILVVPCLWWIRIHLYGFWMGVLLLPPLRRVVRDIGTTLEQQSHVHHEPCWIDSLPSHTHSYLVTIILTFHMKVTIIYLKQILYRQVTVSIVEIGKYEYKTLWINWNVYNWQNDRKLTYERIARMIPRYQ